jgi:DNA-directed RNA polymerase subunit RPC12/RpoP
MKKKLIEGLPLRLKHPPKEKIIDAWEEAGALILDIYWHERFNRRMCLTAKECFLWDGAIWNQSSISYQETKKRTEWTKNSDIAIYNFAQKIGAGFIVAKKGHEWSNVRQILEVIRTGQHNQRYNARERRIQYKIDITPEEIPSKLTETLESHFRRDFISLSSNYCTACGKEVDTTGHKPGEEGTCPRCKAKITYTRRALKDQSERQEYAIIQNTYDDNLVVRYFETQVEFKQNEKKKIFSYEKVRIYLDPMLRYIGKLIGYHNNYTGQDYWWDANEYGSQVIYGNRTILIDTEKGILCDEAEKTFEALAEAGISVKLKFALDASLKRLGVCEKLAKVGLKKLCTQIASDGYDWPYIDFRAAELKKALGISKDMLRWATKNDIGKGELLILQEGFKDNKGLNLEEICKLAKAKTSIERLAEVCENRKIVKLFNYLDKQSCYKDIEETLSHYVDYIHMAREFGLDLSRDTARYPKDLKTKHDELSIQHNILLENKKEKEKNEKFKDIARRQEELLKEYGFKDKQFEIRVPRNAGEIVREGRTLHHCVGGDNYLQKHARGESAIVFLRHITEPETPYYTIEIKEDRILQYYGMNDRKPDKEVVDKFLEKWKKHIRKGLKNGTDSKQLSAV